MSIVICLFFHLGVSGGILALEFQTIKKDVKDLFLFLEIEIIRNRILSIPFEQQKKFPTDIEKVFYDIVVSQT